MFYLDFQDKCTGDCECPPGMVGRQPFCQPVESPDIFAKHSPGKVVPVFDLAESPNKKEFLGNELGNDLSNN